MEIDALCFLGASLRPLRSTCDHAASRFHAVVPEGRGYAPAAMIAARRSETHDSFPMDPRSSGTMPRSAVPQHGVRRGPCESLLSRAPLRLGATAIQARHRGHPPRANASAHRHRCDGSATAEALIVAISRLPVRPRQRSRERKSRAHLPSRSRSGSRQLSVVRCVAEGRARWCLRHLSDRGSHLRARPKGPSIPRTPYPPGACGAERRAARGRFLHTPGTVQVCRLAVRSAAVSGQIEDAGMRPDEIGATSMPHGSLHPRKRQRWRHHCRSRPSFGGSGICDITGLLQQVE